MGRTDIQETFYLKCGTRSNRWKFQAERPIFIKNKLELFFKIKTI